MIGFLIDYIPELMPTHFEYCKPLVFTVQYEIAKPKPKPKPLPQLPEYIKAIKSLFRDFYFNCKNKDKDRQIPLNHYFKNNKNNNLRDYLTTIYKPCLHHRHFFFQNSITPFSFRISRPSLLRSHGGGIEIFKNDSDQIINRYDARLSGWYDWTNLGGKSIKEKKCKNGNWGDLNPRYIDTDDLKDWCVNSGLELKKSWSRKTMIKKLIKMT